MIRRVLQRSVAVLSWPLVQLAWSGAFIRALGAITSRLPVRTYRVSYEGTYLYASSFDRYLALLLWKFGGLESYELHLIGSLITPGMRILDIGANVGFHTLKLARFTGETGSVIAFEPEPRNFADLSRTIAASGLTHVTARQAAVSDTDGSIQLHVSPGHGGDHRVLAGGGSRHTITVEAVTIDRLFGGSGQRVDFVKIDIQGAEHLALRGMRQVLAENPQMIVVLEFSPAMLKAAGVNPDEVATLIASVGRPLQVIDHDERRCENISLDGLKARAVTSRQIDLLMLPVTAAAHG